MNQCSKNFYLFILWEKGRFKQKEILDDIFQNFNVLQIYEITWKKEDFAASLARFYGKKLPKGCKKEKETGSGSFLAIWVSDHNETVSNGDNANIISTKKRYRKILGANLLHASDNCLETEENTLFLLGKNLNELLRESPHTDIQPYAQNITGYPCWRDKDEVINFIKKCPDTFINLSPKFVISTKHPNLVKKLLAAEKRLFPNKYCVRTQQGKLYFLLKKLS